MGCWCSPLPTAYLSACTIFPPSQRFVFRDLTQEMERAAEELRFERAAELRDQIHALEQN